MVLTLPIPKDEVECKRATLTDIFRRNFNFKRLFCGLTPVWFQIQPIDERSAAILLYFGNFNPLRGS